MKRLLVPLAIALLLNVAPASAGEEEKPPAEAGDPPAESGAPPAEAGATSKDSSLVEAAKKNKSRKKSTKKVITNADVKKSKGTLIVVDKPAPPPVATSSVGPITQYDIDRKARHEAEENVTEEQKRVTELEKELARIEQSYYDENDPTYRDNVIQKRFDATRAQLDAARQELAGARESLEKLTPKQQP